MKRVLIVAALVTFALSSYAAAQGFVSRCGRVKNGTDFNISVYTRGSSIPTNIGPHSTGTVCAGR
jgi:hypothetical protein